MILSIANTVGIIGVGVYTYRQIATVQAELVELTKHLTNVAKRVGELEAMGQRLGDLARVVGELNNNLGQLTAQVDEAPTAEDVDYLAEDVEAIIAAVAENGITVERSEPPRRDSRSRGGRRREPPRSRGRPRGRGAPRQWERGYEDEEESYDDTASQIDAVRRARERRGR